MNSYGLEYLRDKKIKIVCQKKLNELKKGDMFLYKNMLCCAITVSKYFVSFENNIRQDFNTTRVDQIVYVVEWTQKYKYAW